MQDLVFREFLDFVETRFVFSPAWVEEGESGYGKLLAIVDQLGRTRAVPRSELLRNFGSALFRRAAALCPIFFGDTDSAFEFLASLHRRVHEDLAMLYPQVRIPELECRRALPGQIEILFRSDYPLADLAAGLIEGCGEYYQDHIRVERRELPATRGQTALFVVTRGMAGAQPLTDAMQQESAAGPAADSQEIPDRVTPFPGL